MSADTGTTAVATGSIVMHESVTDALIEQVHEDGYAVLADAVSPQDMSDLHAETVRLCHGELGEIAGNFEINPDESDLDVLRRYVCIHMPHKLSTVFRQALTQPRIIDALTRIIGPNVKAMQSMIFMKSTGKPGQPWHQDEYFIPTRDRSLTAVWIALDDATVDNGCLWVLPGSHRRGVIYPARDQDDPQFDCSIEAYDFPYTDDDAVPVQIPAGAAVIFNGYLLHRSLPNAAEHSFRRSLVNHYMSAESLLPWFRPPEGVHVAQWDYRDIVTVAGTDPYAYKGTADLSRALVRPDGDGGCER